MASMEDAWPVDAFDAVDISCRDSQLTIEGTAGDRVTLESDRDDNFSLATVGRWLQIYASGPKRDAQFVLHLPERKAWTVNLFSDQAQLKAEAVRARLNLMFGKGEIQAEDCLGALSVMSGKASIQLKHFTEVEIPRVPPPPGEWKEREGWPDRWDAYRDQLDVKVAERVLSRFFKQSGPAGQNSGIDLQIARSDLQLEDLNLREFIVRSARGDIKLKRGTVAKLDLDFISGDIECESCMPAGDWSVNASRGDIRLSLPADALARLDVATRRGDIKSTMPMVRVARQGPEAWRGGRMVGTLGASPTGKMPEIHLVTLRGDIKIDTQPAIGHSTSKLRPESESPQSTPEKSKPYNTPLSVLKALSEGQIGVEEADRLLRKLKS